MIYIVEGSTGEYSDHREWPVRAFTNEAHAKLLVEALEEWIRINEVALADYEVRYNIKCPLDPSFQVDYTGTRYYYFAIPLDEEAWPEK